MRCPNCGADLGAGMLPTRCPSCGASLSRGRTSPADRRADARAARDTRRSVEGLSGVGRGRRDGSYTAKRVVRLIVGFAIVGMFCAILYVVAYRSELIGGKSVPDVTGWNAERAASRLESDGFPSTTVEVASTGEPVGSVSKQDPAAGARVEEGTTVTLSVATTQPATSLPKE